MIDIQSWLNTVSQLMIAGGVGYGIYQRIMADRHARDIADKVEEGNRVITQKLTEVKEQTNGMSHRLETLAGEAGEAREATRARAEAEAKAKE
jgi:hypothetical protein